MWRNRYQIPKCPDVLYTKARFHSFISTLSIFTDFFFYKTTFLVKHPYVPIKNNYTASAHRICIQRTLRLFWLIKLLKKKRTMIFTRSNRVCLDRTQLHFPGVCHFGCAVWVHSNQAGSLVNVERRREVGGAGPDCTEQPQMSSLLPSFLSSENHGSWAQQPT